jgi:hypothetical protein
MLLLPARPFGLHDAKLPGLYVVATDDLITAGRDLLSERHTHAAK